jgi:hypothetical protein
MHVTLLGVGRWALTVLIPCRCGACFAGGWAGVGCCGLLRAAVWTGLGRRPGCRWDGSEMGSDGRRSSDGSDGSMANLVARPWLLGPRRAIDDGLARLGRMTQQIVCQSGALFPNPLGPAWSARQTLGGGLVPFFAPHRRSASSVFPSPSPSSSPLLRQLIPSSPPAVVFPAALQLPRNPAPAAFGRSKGSRDHGSGSGPQPPPPSPNCL